jgi:RecA-family ATPase
MSYIKEQAMLAAADNAFSTAAAPKSSDLPGVQPDAEMMRDYFRRVYADLTTIAWETGAVAELKTLPATRGQGFTAIAHFAPGDVEGMTAQAVAWNVTPGQNVYSTPGICRRGPNGNATDAGFEGAAYAWADIDDDRSYEDITRISHDHGPAYTLLTGHTWRDGGPVGVRAQMLFRLPEVMRDPAELRAVNSRFRDALGGDPSVVNPSRVMRIPGSTAWGKKHKIGRMTELTFGAWQDSARTVDAEIVRAAATAATAARAERERAWQSEDGKHPENSWIKHLPAEEQLAFIRDLLASTNNQGKNDMPRGTWLRVLFGACHAEVLGIHGAVDLFRDWSYAGGKAATEDEMERDINSYNPHHPNPVRLGTLLRLCGEHGGEATSRAIDEYRAKATYEKTIAEIAKERDRTIAEIKGLPVPESAADAIPSLFSRRIDFASFKGKAIPARQWIVPDWAPAGTATLLYASGGTGKSMLTQQLATATAIGGKWLGMSVQDCKAFCYFSEDDDEELLRRQAAICRAYGADLDGVPDLYTVSGVGFDNLLMTFDHNERGRRTKLLTDLEEQAGDFGARLIVLDTAATSFGGSENNRAQVTQFVTELTKIARRLNGALILNAHPSRAGAGVGGDLDGGSTAWNASVRSRWGLEPMAKGASFDKHVRILTHRKSNYGEMQEPVRLFSNCGVFEPMEGAKAGRSVDDVFIFLLAQFAIGGRMVSDSKNAGNYAPRAFAGTYHPEGYTKAEFTCAMERLFAQQRITVDAVGKESRPQRCITSVPA